MPRNLFKEPGTPYILAFILTLALGAVIYHFNSAIANFVIGSGLIALAYGIVLQVVDAVRHHQNGSVAE